MSVRLLYCGRGFPRPDFAQVARKRVRPRSPASVECGRTEERKHCFRWERREEVSMLSVPLSLTLWHQFVMLRASRQRSFSLCSRPLWSLHRTRASWAPCQTNLASAPRPHRPPSTEGQRGLSVSTKTRRDRNTPFLFDMEGERGAFTSARAHFNPKHRLIHSFAPCGFV
jgi:hypothetical protein